MIKVSLFQGRFSCFLNCTNATRSRKASHIANVEVLLYFGNHPTLNITYCVSPNTGKHGQEKPPYLDTFHAVARAWKLILEPNQ